MVAVQCIECAELRKLQEADDQRVRDGVRALVGAFVGQPAKMDLVCRALMVVGQEGGLYDSRKLWTAVTEALKE